MTTVLIAAPATVSRAADLVAPGTYAAVTDSDCAAPRNLAAIERKFRVQANEVHHQPALDIVSITDIRENRYLPAREDITSVDRLYCKASAGMSDGRTRTLWYMIEYGEGFAGAFGDNVEFCLSGLDRWNVHDGACRVLR
ncbi:hypothetical protein [Oricola thermophila]|nr:hypothetical protein [Oricola thermophila]